MEKRQFDGRFIRVSSYEAAVKLLQIFEKRGKNMNVLVSCKDVQSVRTHRIGCNRSERVGTGRNALDCSLKSLGKKFQLGSVRIGWDVSHRLGSIGIGTF